MWEQRYGILKAERTETNIRFYNSDDMKLLLNISLLNQNGYKISKIANMKPGEIHQLVIDHWKCCEKVDGQVNALVVSMVEMDEERFEKIISQNILKLGLEKTMVEVVYPLFNKIGLLWQTCAISPAQEHFISNLVRQKIIVAIDGQMAPGNPDAKKYLLYLPEGELHEVGLLFAAYILKSRGQKVIYLGQNLPFVDLISVCKTYKPDYVFSIITTRWEPQALDQYLGKLIQSLPQTELMITGSAITAIDYQVPKGIKVFRRISELIEMF